MLDAYSHLSRKPAEPRRDLALALGVFGYEMQPVYNPVAKRGVAVSPAEKVEIDGKVVNETDKGFFVYFFGVFIIGF